MAKRFSETDKWNDEWFSDLKPLQKLVFLFLVDRCDNAGFIEVNARINSFLIGITPEQYEGAIKGLDKCLISSHDGKKLWLVNFLKYQKNLPLNFENNAHKQIISLLSDNQQRFTFNFENLGAKEGLISPIGKGKGKGNKGGLGENDWDHEKRDFLCNEGWQYQFVADKNVLLEELKKQMQDFVKDIELKRDYKTANELRSHFTNWFNLNKKSKSHLKVDFKQANSAPPLRSASEL